MKQLVCALFASTALGLSATAADARCSYITERTLFFAAGSIDCLPIAEGCGPYEDILDSVAELWREAGGGTLYVTGHSDTFASAEESMTLSGGRASRVRDQLVARGIDPDWIATAAIGEANLARPTSDGVIEDLNNRVTVEFSDSARRWRQLRNDTYRREAEAAIAAGVEPPPRPIC